MVVDTTIIHVGVVRMSQGVAKASLSAAADEIDLGRSNSLFRFMLPAAAVADHPLC